MQVAVLHGPNLNLLGAREPEVYGTGTLQDLEHQIEAWAGRLGVEVTFLQTNHEGQLIDGLQGCRSDGIIINPGALTHTSRAIGDAIRAIAVPTVEVHISDVKAREPWRAVSLVSDACVRTIYGRGIGGYRDALRHLVNRSVLPFSTLRYGPHQENVADLRRPEGAPVGLVVLVHGGFWRRQFERDSMESLAVDLTGRGMTTLNLEYRRLGQGGGWPGSAHDVVTAMRHISNVPDLAPLPTAIIGHSAGGHLALWAGRRERSRAVELMVGLAAVTDLVALAESGSDGSVEARVLLVAGAPRTLALPEDGALLVHGEEDTLLAPTQATSRAGQATIEVVPGLGHYEMLDPKRDHWPPVVAELTRSLT